MSVVRGQKGGSPHLPIYCPLSDLDVYTDLVDRIAFNVLLSLVIIKQFVYLRRCPLSLLFVSYVSFLVQGIKQYVTVSLFALDKRYLLD